MTGEDFWIFSKNGVLRKNQAVFYHILTKNLLESGIRMRLRPVRVPADGVVRGRVPRSAAQFRGPGALKWGGRQDGCRAAPASAARDRPESCPRAEKSTAFQSESGAFASAGSGMDRQPGDMDCCRPLWPLRPQHFPDLFGLKSLKTWRPAASVGAVSRSQDPERRRTGEEALRRAPLSADPLSTRPGTSDTDSAFCRTSNRIAD